MTRAAVAAVLLALWAAAAAGCSRNPATGDPQFPILFGSETEAELGDEEHRDVVREHGGLHHNPAATAALRRVVERLAPHVRLADDAAFPWRAFWVDDAAPNAFALSGGRVYFSRGLLALLNDDAELAAVVAHEMGHVAARHGAARRSATIFAQIAYAAAVIAGAEVGYLGEGLELSLSAYSRHQESEADALAVGYLAAAGYDPRAAGRVMRSLRRLQLYDERIGARAPGFSVYQTHPMAEDRVVAIDALAGELPPGGDAGDREAFLAGLDGVGWGDVPAAGYVRGRSFVHPDLGVRFTVPDGYRLSTAAKRVAAENPTTGGLILFDLAASGGAVSPADYLTRLWAATAPLRDVQQTKISGYAAAVGETRLATPHGEATVVAAVVFDDRRRRVFRFACLAPAGSGDPAAFQRMIGGFGSVARAALNRQTAERLQILRAAPGENIANLAARIGRLPHAPQLLRMLNGLDEGEEPIPGRLLKTIVAD